MIPAPYKLALGTTLVWFFYSPAYADVSYAGYYLALAVVLIAMFVPVIIVALSHRTRKRLYLAAHILWAIPTFAYLWLTGARQNEFILVASLPYAFLVIYFLKEKRLVKSNK